MSIHVSYNQPDNEIHSYDGKPSAVVTGAGPAVIDIHMTAGEWDAANRLYYRQEATGVDGFVQASESNNQQFLLPCAYLASGELQIALNNQEQGLTTNLMKISITKMSSSGDLSDDDPQFTIDNNKRLVIVPGSQGILAVQFDNESESVTFKFPRYQDGVDLSTKTPYVNYRLPNSDELGKSLCSIDADMLTAEYIYFSWTIDINVTMFEGSIKFQVEFSDSQGYRWQSQIAELPILTSLYNTGLEPYSPSFLEEVLRQMQQYSSDAEAFAVGTRNGVPVAEGDPAYENNAKHYALTGVKTVNHAQPDANGNVSLLPWQLQYSNTIAGQSVADVEEALDALVRKKFELPSGGQSGQILVSNGNEGASWTTLEDTSGLPSGDEVSY